MKRGRLVRQVAVSEDDVDLTDGKNASSQNARPSLNHFTSSSDPNFWNVADDVASPDDSTRKFMKGAEGEGPALFKPRHVMESIGEQSNQLSQVSTPRSADINSRGDGRFSFSDTSPLATKTTAVLLMDSKEVSKSNSSTTQGIIKKTKRAVICRSNTVVHVSESGEKTLENNGNRSTDSSSSDDDDNDNKNDDRTETRSDLNIHTTLPNANSRNYQSAIPSAMSALDVDPNKKNVGKAVGIECDAENRKKHLWARMPPAKD